MQIVGFPMRWLICLFVLRFNVPVNNDSVMSGQSHRFLGISQYYGKLMSLAQEHNMVPSAGIERQNSESDALPLCHHAPLFFYLNMHNWNSIRITPYTLLLYSKTVAHTDIHFYLIYARKHRL